MCNDNKITGAKNVLLLIVSGAQEITIDEIGEINDHIQNEAGHGANIIMGVGEDESLEESIAVTIIATGFNIEQQDEITNTETKKVVHSLSEEQDLDSIEKEPVVIEPIIVLEEKKEAPVVRHTLDLETEEDMIFSKKEEVKESYSDLELISTSEIIKNINVVYDEVRANIANLEEDEDFIIKPVTRMVTDIEDVQDIEVISDYIEEEQQITLTFDLPLSASSEDINEQKEDVVSYDLTDDIKDIAVNDYVELITVNETNEEGDIRYALDDYVEVESSINQTQQVSNEVLEEVDEEVVFEKKIIKESVFDEEVAEEIDPMNSPISELLKERAEERRRKMKDFNYKFNSAKIDDIEKVPAYRRQGVNLNEAKHSSETDMSRTSIGLDDNDDIQLRSNNSFLHDNVD